MLLSITRTLYAHAHARRFDQKGFSAFSKEKKIKRKDKRGESLRSLEENLTYSSNSAQSGFGSFKSFDPFFLHLFRVLDQSGGEVSVNVQ